MMKFFALALIAILCTACPGPEPDPVVTKKSENIENGDSNNNSESPEPESEPDIEELIEKNVSVEYSYYDFIYHYKIKSTLHNVISDDITFGVGHGEIDGEMNITTGASENEYYSGNTYIKEIENPFWNYYLFGIYPADTEVAVQLGFYYGSYMAILNEDPSKWSDGEKEMYEFCEDFFDKYEREALKYYDPSIQVIIGDEHYEVEATEITGGGSDNGGSGDDNGGNGSGYTPANPEVDEYGIAVSQEVDLGLSVNWAGWNVGATSPEEYGGYYAWGETEEKYNYDWGYYKWCRGDYNTLTKYCTHSSRGTVDNKTVLDKEDDVAYVKWGNGWRMPTKEELEELTNTNNCTWEWITYNGVNGYKVTGKSLPNGKRNSIFLPATGVRNVDAFYLAGSSGGYWSSTLCSVDSNVAWVMSVGNYLEIFELGRCFGRSVRPVKGK